LLGTTLSRYETIQIPLALQVSLSVG